MALKANFDELSWINFIYFFESAFAIIDLLLSNMFGRISYESLSLPFLNSKFHYLSPQNDCTNLSHISDDENLQHSL